MIVWPCLLMILAQDTFEAASIRPSQAQNNNSGITTSRGGVKTGNTSLLGLILFAYRIHPYQVIGASGWMEDLRWDVNARNPDGDSGDGKSVEPALARMRNLLAERFQLKLKQETRELPVYGLVVEKTGLKVKPEEGGNGSTHTNQNNGSGRITGQGIRVKDLALILSAMVGRTILDETGLGDTKYQIELNWTDGGSGDGPSIFTAVREQLGLRLESKKGPVPVYVVEKAEKPSEN